jgi:hypothetical protein
VELDSGEPVPALEPAGCALRRVLRGAARQCGVAPAAGGGVAQYDFALARYERALDGPGGALRGRVEPPERLDPVAEELHAEGLARRGLRGKRREHVHDAAAMGVFPRLGDAVGVQVARGFEPAKKFFETHRAARPKGHGRLVEDRKRREPHRGGRRGRDEKGKILAQSERPERRRPLVQKARVRRLALEGIARERREFQKNFPRRVGPQILRKAMERVVVRNDRDDGNAQQALRLGQEEGLCALDRAQKKRRRAPSEAVQYGSGKHGFILRRPGGVGELKQRNFRRFLFFPPACKLCLCTEEKPRRVGARFSACIARSIVRSGPRDGGRATGRSKFPSGPSSRRTRRGRTSSAPSRTSSAPAS